MKTFHLGRLLVGPAPRVVGTISAASTLASRAGVTADACDVVELRLDRMAERPIGWLEEAAAIEREGFPVLVTVRLKAEGGGWGGADQARAPLLSEALGALAAIDVEFRSRLVSELCGLASERGKCAIVSYHNFDRTPDLGELTDIVRRIAEFEAALPKIATMVKGPNDLATLEQLLAADFGRPICVIGMGDSGAETRTRFPQIGSCLTYGYLDVSAAPGQSACADLVRELSRQSPAYRKERLARSSSHVGRGTA